MAAVGISHVGTWPGMDMTAEIAKSLTSLRVRLNDTISSRNFQEDEVPTTLGADAPSDNPLHLADSHFPELVNNWNDCVDCLAASIEPRQLSLEVICDVADEETALAMMAPIRKLPTLKHCFIRLWQHPNSRLQDVARHIVLSAVDINADLPTQPFPFTRLPMELRLHILSFTDLITPTKQVEWDPQRRYRYRWPISELTGVCNGHAPCTCSDEFHPNYKHRLLENVEQLPPQLYCSRYCTAYEAPSPKWSPNIKTCPCWAPPTPLFLVERSFLSAARKVFFNGNKFIVRATERLCGDIRDTVGHVKGPPEIVRFLPVARPGLQYIRSLEIVYPFYEDGGVFSRASQWANSTVRRALEIFKGELNLPNLTVSVHVPDYGSYSDGADTIWIFAGVDRSRAARADAAHIDATRAFRPLRGVKDFFVHLHRPWEFDTIYHWDEMNGWHNQSFDQCTVDEVQRRETWRERLVMGDSYNSKGRGKTLARSTWAAVIDRENSQFQRQSWSEVRD